MSFPIPEGVAGGLHCRPGHPFLPVVSFVPPQLVVQEACVAALATFFCLLPPYPTGGARGMCCRSGRLFQPVAYLASLLAGGAGSLRCRPDRLFQLVTSIHPSLAAGSGCLRCATLLVPLSCYFPPSSAGSAGGLRCRPGRCCFHFRRGVCSSAGQRLSSLHHYL